MTKLYSFLRLKYGNLSGVIRAALCLVLALCIFGNQIAVAQNRNPLFYPFYDPNSTGDACAPTSSPGNATPGSIYVIGDSLTVGMRDSGDLKNKFESAGFTPATIDAIGGKTLSWGIEQIATSREAVAAGKYIVLGLGTNNLHNVVSSGSNEIAGGKDTAKDLMRQLYAAARQANPTAKIYWTSFFGQGDHSIGGTSYNYPTAYRILNEALTELKTEADFTIIPWSTSQEAPQYISSDGLHYNNYGAMADFIVNAVSTNETASSSTGAGCACTTSGVGGELSRDERYRETWGYLTTQKGLSEEATAGLMGNLEAESGINPHNTQDSAPAPDGPEIPIELIRGRYGYGIAQWTTAVRQENLIAYARETNRSTGDLGLQLDFLWKELAENYTGVLTVLQTPGVTIAEASYEVLARFETPLPFTDKGTQAQRDAETANRLNKSRAIFDEFSGQAIGSTIGGGCNVSGVSIDLESPDTSHVACAAGTIDANKTDGYRKGKQYVIRLCSVGGTKVNSQISGSIVKLLADSSAAGIKISIGSYRAMSGCANCQVEMYQSRCIAQGLTPTPGPYPKASYSDYQACDSIAPPGYSNHQMGLAIDVSCDGTLVPRYHPEAASNPCYQWLVANASKYGFYEFDKGQGNKTSGSYEAWHWSVDGD